MACEETAGGTFNVCRGEEVTIEEVAARIAGLIGLDAPPLRLPSRPHDVLRLLGDASRLRRVLGRSPEMGIDDGLARTVEWYRRNVVISKSVLASMRNENWTAVPTEAWLNR